MLFRPSRTRLVLGVAALALATAACGGSSTKTPTASGSTAPSATPGASASASAAASSQPVGVVYDIGGRGDRSFNDAAARGLDKAVTELGLQKKELEPNAAGDNRGELLELLASQKASPIIGVGFLFGDAITKAAKAHPDTTFGIVDSVVDAKNVKSLVFAEEQGSYLVGAAAALTSKTGKLGYIGGVQTDLLKKFQAGFVAGAKKINPKITVDVKYITVPPDFSGFAAPDKAKEIAKAQFAGGADIIYAAAGGSGAGVFEAAKEGSTSSRKLWAIGVDSDQYNLVDASIRPFILTSMLKKVDTAVYDEIKAYEGGDKSGGTQLFDLKADGVGYSTSGGFITAYVPQLEALKKQIIAGTIVVPTKP